MKEKEMKHSSRYSQTALLCVVVIILTTAAGPIAAQTRQEPLSYYTDLIPATRAEINGWIDPISGNLLSIDTLGRANARFGLNLPTIVTGSVRVMSLKDGTEQVTVDITTANAACWGNIFEQNIGFIPAFGYRPTELVGTQLLASTGSQRLHVEYRPQPAGQFSPRGGIYSQRATVSCEGTLRSESGFMSGASGRAHTTQISLYTTGVPSGCPPEHDGDCYTSERVEFMPTGH